MLCRTALTFTPLTASDNKKPAARGGTAGLLKLYYYSRLQ
ncbi:hypothetical protein RNAN_2915 [Rheinheimera nanhaiensis E407-8]|uniref:Uncharacterized protein n=1 Tax=Rheinheimera nanhaiensis E407-8 TaxID=562729 RepID=I1E0S4_9GAMM|nr:hypothetical protein RNAN_2915 [Rheinheimera nanhaiensis E407-8]